ncbi:MAG: hypothetical protein ABEK50_00220 [bacterium]
MQHLGISYCLVIFVAGMVSLGGALPSHAHGGGDHVSDPDRFPRLGEHKKKEKEEKKKKEKEKNKNAKVEDPKHKRSKRLHKMNRKLRQKQKVLDNREGKALVQAQKELIELLLKQREKLIEMVRELHEKMVEKKMGSDTNVEHDSEPGHENFESEKDHIVDHSHKEKSGHSQEEKSNHSDEDEAEHANEDEGKKHETEH